MIRFNTLTMKNFLSYGAVPTVINLDRPGTTLMLGEDLDNTADGVGANGVGKTVIVNALVYALYDKPISNISKDNLVNNINKKHMEVTLNFEKDGKQYFIQRVRKMKAGAAGNWVKFTEDGKDLSLDVAATNDLIEKVLGLPFELFVRIVAVSATHTPFLDLPVRHVSQANQTDIIEELFDLKTLSDKATALKKDIRDTDDSLKIQKVRVDGLEKEHARHEIQITTAKGRVEAWRATNKKEKAALVRKLKKVADVDVEDMHTKIDRRDELLAVCNEHSPICKTEKKNIADLKKDVAAEDKKQSELEDNKCYTCHQQIKDAKVQIAKSKDEQKTFAKKIKASEKRLKAAQEIYEPALNEWNDLNDEIGDITNKDLTDIHKDQTDLEDKMKANNPFDAALQELLDVELDPIEMDKINELTTTSEHQKFLLKLLTKKDSFVRKALLNKNIPFLNKRLALYLTELGLPHNVEFTHEMTASISQFGRPMDFGNLSNGQRARVNIGLSFAFRDVLQSIHSRVNVCMLDEILDVGLDAIGVRAAAKMLKRKSREEKISLYIISHRDEIDSAFDRRMLIQMSKGFSYINEDE